MTKNKCKDCPYRLRVELKELMDKTASELLRSIKSYKPTQIEHKKATAISGEISGYGKLYLSNLFTRF